jgi:hypothetical protein
MPGMKVTPDAAMRARDVSRPHAEHVARAEQAEARAADAAGGAVAAGDSAEEIVTAEADDAVEIEVVAKTEVVVESDVTGGSHRRRIRGIRSSRRGRPSR